MRFRHTILIFVLIVFACKPQQDISNSIPEKTLSPDSIISPIPISEAGRGALLLTSFRSMDELSTVVDFEYTPAHKSFPALFGKEQSHTIHRSGGHEVVSTLKKGTTEADIIRARTGNLWDKIVVGFKCPYAVINRKKLMSIECLGRKKRVFGKGDIAFYDLAETMVYNIAEDDLSKMSAAELSGKGYLNTFNHVVAQAFITTLFSERFADFVADVHERNRLPELITGKFTEHQMTDLDNGPVDNYIDMVNNEWGQELGQALRKKYKIHTDTHWTPGLLTNYMNDLQDYHSWAFQIRFRPFRATDDMMIRFANKINAVKELVENYNPSKPIY